MTKKTSAVRSKYLVAIALSVTCACGEITNKPESINATYIAGNNINIFNSQKKLKLNASENSLTININNYNTVGIEIFEQTVSANQFTMNSVHNYTQVPKSMQKSKIEFSLPNDLNSFYSFETNTKENSIIAAQISSQEYFIEREFSNSHPILTGTYTNNSNLALNANISFFKNSNRIPQQINYVGKYNYDYAITGLVEFFEDGLPKSGKIETKYNSDTITSYFSCIKNKELHCTENTRIKINNHESTAKKNIAFHPVSVNKCETTFKGFNYYFFLPKPNLFLPNIPIEENYQTSEVNYLSNAFIWLDFLPLACSRFILQRTEYNIEINNRTYKEKLSYYNTRLIKEHSITYLNNNVELSSISKSYNYTNNEISKITITHNGKEENLTFE